MYKITKDSNSERTLYLPHPAIQLKVCNLYRDYNQLITHLCNRSSFSLRYPSKIADSYYAKTDSSDFDPSEKFKDEGAAIDGDIDPVYASTFFEYKDVGFLYKFYDSYQFHRIEKKFNKLFKFDIAKCFPSISTFQLSKSIRELESYIKSKNHHSFENLFERLMTDANLGEHHGIVVGPEFSRIFSEILLQSIDCEVKNKLEIEHKLFENKDYVVKRYVDDYFLFHNNEHVRQLVYRTITEELENYKLYCNESKNQSFGVPFITGVTIAKQQYKHLIQNIFNKFDRIDKEKKIMGVISPMNRYYQISNQLITDIKCIVFNNGISYSSITGYYFTLARVKVSEIEEHISDFKDDKNQCERMTNFLLIIIELSFFVYSMDFRVRSTYLISQIIIIINKIANSLGKYNSEIIKKKIYDESYLAIKSSINKNTMRDIECLNLLIAIRDIDISYQLSKDVLETIVNLDIKDKTNYFSLMTSLFYVQDKRAYSSTRTKVVNCILEKFNREYFTVKNDSELIHIFFDSLSCPYLTRKMKAQIADRALSRICKLNEGDIDEIVDQISKQNWFIDWDISSSESIERLLTKKELKSPYGS
nr:antiviral reverse transcriptase Drt3b [Pseudoalteromonas rubra]